MARYPGSSLSAQCPMVVRELVKPCRRRVDQASKVIQLNRRHIATSRLTESTVSRPPESADGLPRGLLAMRKPAARCESMLHLIMHRSPLRERRNQHHSQILQIPGRDPPAHYPSGCARAHRASSSPYFPTTVKSRPASASGMRANQCENVPASGLWQVRPYGLERHDA